MNRCSNPVTHKFTLLKTGDIYPQCEECVTELVQKADEFGIKYSVEAIS